MSFRTRLSLFFITIVVVPLATVAVLLLGLSRDSQTGKADARIGQGMRTALALYAWHAREARAQLDRALADPPMARALVAGDRARLRRRARQLARRRAGPISIAVYDRSGRLAARAGTPDALAAATAAARARDGRRLGAVAVSSTRAPAYVEEVKRLTALEVRATRDRTLLASTLGPGDRAPAKARIDLAGRSYRGRLQRVAEPMGRPVWVGVFEESSELTRAIERARTAVAGAVLALILLALAFAVYIVRGVQAQIGQFLAAARCLRKGDFSRRVDVQGRDEFARLGLEFNQMSDQLSAKIEQVERERHEVQKTMRRVGEAFASGLDLEERVAFAVETAVDACAAEAARALPIDARKMREKHLGSHEPSLLAALEAAERTAVEIHQAAGARAPDERRPAAIELGGVHALAAPLMATGGAPSESEYLGVMSVARRGLRFSDSERDQFAYLAPHAAVAIDHANLHKSVEMQSVTDELTGLTNVRQFHRILHREVERSRRFGTIVGLVMLDIDNFKRVNDTYGHQQGDVVLVRVAGALREVSRDIDEPVRYGGEEMAIVLPGTNLEGAAFLAERMRAAVEALVVERLDGEGTIAVTASFGVSSVPESAREKDALIAVADAALYRAKRGGKNRVERAETAPVPH